MHDKNGKPVKKGDRVIVEAVIGDTYATPDFCNVQLHIGHEQEHSAHNVHGTLTINSKQVELIEES